MTAPRGPQRRTLVAAGLLLLVVVALVYGLTTSMPTFWCSLIGTCNQ